MRRFFQPPAHWSSTKLRAGLSEFPEEVSSHQGFMTLFFFPLGLERNRYMTLTLSDLSALSALPYAEALHLSCIKINKDMILFSHQKIFNLGDTYCSSTETCPSLTFLCLIFELGQDDEDYVPLHMATVSEGGSLKWAGRLYKVVSGPYYYYYFFKFISQFFLFSNKEIIWYILKVSNGYSYIIDKLGVKD